MCDSNYDFIGGPHSSLRGTCRRKDQSLKHVWTRKHRTKRTADASLKSVTTPNATCYTGAIAGWILNFARYIRWTVLTRFSQWKIVVIGGNLSRGRRTRRVAHCSVSCAAFVQVDLTLRSNTWMYAVLSTMSWFWAAKLSARKFQVKNMFRHFDFHRFDWCVCLRVIYGVMYK